jgi:hypothetical protein
MHPTTHKENAKVKRNHARIPHKSGTENEVLKQHWNIVVFCLLTSVMRIAIAGELRQYKLRCIINNLKSCV